MKTLKESILASGVAESILNGGAEASFNNVEIFEKAKKWLNSYATTVKDLKINEDGTLDAEKITFRGRLDLYTLPDYVRLNYVKHYVVEGCQQWHGYKGYPKKCDKLYLEGLFNIKDFQNFEDSEIDWLIIVECHRLGRDLKIPKNHNIKSVRMARNRWGKYDDDYEKQFKRAHIKIVP